MLNNDCDRTQVWCPTCKCAHNAAYQSEGNVCYLLSECPKEGARRVQVSSDSNLFRALREKRRPVPLNTKPRTMWHYLHLLDSCSLNCPVCFAKAEVGKGRLMTLADLRTRAETIVAQKGGKVLLTGGEPTEHPDFLEIVRILSREYELEVSVITNGVRLGEVKGFAHACKQAGLASVNLSFDTFDPEVSRLMRGRKDLIAIKRNALDNLLAAGLICILNVMICSANEKETGALIKYALEHAPGVQMLLFQPLQEAGRYVPGLQGIDREGVVHAIVDSGAIPGLTVDDFMPQITSPMLGFCIHPDCGALLPLAVQKDGSVKILARDEGFQKFLDDLNRFKPCSRLQVFAKIAWSLLRNMGLRGIRLVTNKKQGRKKEALMTILVDNLMPPDRQDMQRLHQCSACLCLKDGGSQPLCACLTTD